MVFPSGLTSHRKHRPATDISVNAAEKRIVNGHFLNNVLDFLICKWKSS